MCFCFIADGTLKLFPLLKIARTLMGNERLTEPDLRVLSKTLTDMAETVSRNHSLAVEIHSILDVRARMLMKRGQSPPTPSTTQQLPAQYQRISAEDQQWLDNASQNVSYGVFLDFIKDKIRLYPQLRQDLQDFLRGPI